MIERGERQSRGRVNVNIRELINNYTQCQITWQKTTFTYLHHDILKCKKIYRLPYKSIEKLYRKILLVDAYQEATLQTAQPKILRNLVKLP